jgi:hypothetical protein
MIFNFRKLKRFCRYLSPKELNTKQDFVNFLLETREPIIFRLVSAMDLADDIRAQVLFKHFNLLSKINFDLIENVFDIGGDCSR